MKERSVVEPAYLLDANICIYLLEGKSDLAAARVSACPVGQLVTSAVVYAEVMIGARRLDRADRALAFFGQVPVLPFDAAAGDAYSHLPFRRGSYDRLIAANALALGLTVVTGNDADFADVPGLKVENWTV
jgi:tRNA(fMet)-specific endonuclease VapC